MMNYTELKSNRQQFLARTGLTPEAFQRLRTAFQQTYERWFPPDLTRAGHPRQRLVGGGRKSSLESPEQKRLFILVYLKTYALPIVLGERFAMSQPRANPWIHRLLPIRREALDNGGVLPERTAGHFAPSQAGPGRPASSVDATERRRQRPQNPEKQALCYRGRKKKHGAKNVVIVPVRKQRVEFLSRTYAGKTHEKKIVDREGIVYPPGTVWYKDTGFQGYEPPVQKIYQPKKKTRTRELTPSEKQGHRGLASIRVHVEHALAGVKRLRIVKDVFRNTTEGDSDSAMEAACGLHNRRVRSRKTRATPERSQ